MLSVWAAEAALPCPSSWGRRWCCFRRWDHRLRGASGSAGTGSDAFGLGGGGGSSVSFFLGTAMVLLSPVGPPASGGISFCWDWLGCDCDGDCAADWPWLDD